MGASPTALTASMALSMADAHCRPARARDERYGNREELGIVCNSIGSRTTRTADTRRARRTETRKRAHMRSRAARARAHANPQTCAHVPGAARARKSANAHTCAHVPRARRTQRRKGANSHTCAHVPRARAARGTRKRAHMRSCASLAQTRAARANARSRAAQNACRAQRGRGGACAPVYQ